MPLDGDDHPRTAALRLAREQTLAHLSESFARDELSLDDFERRVDRAYASDGAGDLAELVADLSAAPATSLATAPAGAVPAHAGPPERAAQLARALFGNVERRVSGAVAPGARVLSVFGNVELDLRDLELPAGVTELQVRAVFGNVELVVPPTLALECRGAPVFGSFASVERVPRAAHGEPVLRIVGSAVFGNVEVRTLPSRARLAASSSPLARAGKTRRPRGERASGDR